MLPTHIIAIGNSASEDAYDSYTPTGNKKKEIENIRKELSISQKKVLWEILDEARQQVHPRAVENKFLKGLSRGEFCNGAYMKYLSNLLPIHQVLEEAQGELVKVPYLKHFVIHDLFRSKVIQTDLVMWEFIAEKKIVPWPPHALALNFASYIRQTAKRDPEQIVGIMYTLYGTIMSGGQTNKRRLEEALVNIRSYTEDLPEGTGVALFELTKNVNEFKQEWHKKLCEIETLLPEDYDVEAFRNKLANEVTLTFEKILEIIEADVETKHC